MEGLKIGVVLSGGGAKGAYQVGFLKALAEYHIEPYAIAGTSIGAVHGAICASSKNTQEAYEKVEALWERIRSDNPLILATEAILKTFKSFKKPRSRFSKLPNMKEISSILTPKTNLKGYSNKYLFELLQENISLKELKQGLPLYVGITQTSHRSEVDMMKLLLGYLIHQVPFVEHQASFVKLQNVENEDIYKYIVASSALPFIFEAQEIGGKKYRDGCLADTPYGNTPIIPLIQEEKCDFVLVCYLGRDCGVGDKETKWGGRLIEFFPREGCFTTALDPLSFSKSAKLKEWEQIGYEDTKRQLEDLLCKERLIRSLKSSALSNF